MEKKCVSCKFFDMLDNVNGVCRRHAPSPAVIKGNETDVCVVKLPTMKKDDWCGEYIVAEVEGNA